METISNWFMKSLLNICYLIELISYISITSMRIIPVSVYMTSDQIVFQVKADRGEHRTMNFMKNGKFVIAHIKV